MMGTRRELLASLGFVGVVVLGFQAVDPVRHQAAGAVALGSVFSSVRDTGRLSRTFAVCRQETTKSHRAGARRWITLNC